MKSMENLEITLKVLMQALSSFPSPSSDTSNNQARAVLSKDEENIKSPVNKILFDIISLLPKSFLTYFCILEE